jgi:uncharacterized protein YjdB
MLRTSHARSFATTLAFIAAVAGAAGCGGGDDSTSPPPPPPPPTVQSIILSPSTTTLTAVGQTVTLTAQVQLSNGAAGTQAVTWSSSNPAVATVTAGTVTAVASGQTTITASVGAVSAQAVVTVAIPVVQSITITPAQATLTAVGQTTPLSAQVRLSNGAVGAQTPVWSSSSNTVATISATGVVTAVASGQTTITAAVGTITGQATITVAIPTVQTVTVSPATATLTALGTTTRLTAAVQLSNGSPGTQIPTWSSSNPAVATVAGGTVTAVGNGTATITAAVGTVTGTATITVAQAVAAVRLLPSDTVVKSAAQLRGAALDERGNVIPNATLQWTAVTPAIASVTGTGALTPLRTGVGRISVSAGGFSATALVRSVVNVRVLSDLNPLFEYSASAGQRRAFSDVSQIHADARAEIMGRVWSYLETVLPSSGSAQTDMFFTTWPEIWTEASPFCGGVLFPNQQIWQACGSPYWTHLFVPGASPNDFPAISRFLSRQFLLSSMTTVGAFPWFLSGYPLWLSGGTFQGSTLIGAPLPVIIQDFRTGDTQNLLVPLETLVRTNNTAFFENLPQRTPVAVRMAQATLFVSHLHLQYPTVLPAVLGRIRATPGAAFTNDMLLDEITSRTGKSLAQLDTEYLAYARALRP